MKGSRQMAQKTFLQIREAESKAQIIIKNAQEEAAQIIKRAEEETADAFSRFSDTCRQRVFEKKRQTEINTRKNSEDFSKETEKLCAELKEKLSMQKLKAVDAVIQNITT